MSTVEQQLEVDFKNLINPFFNVIYLFIYLVKFFVCPFFSFNRGRMRVLGVLIHIAHVVLRPLLVNIVQKFIVIIQNVLSVNQFNQCPRFFQYAKGERGAASGGGDWTWQQCPLVEGM